MSECTHDRQGYCEKCEIQDSVDNLHIIKAELDLWRAEALAAREFVLASNAYYSSSSSENELNELIYDSADKHYMDARIAREKLVGK